MQTRSLVYWLLPSRKLLRVTAYLVSVCLIAAALAARASYARANEAALALGEQLRGLEDLTDGATVIEVNGERFQRATVFSDQPLRTVLDRIQAGCEASPGLLGQVGTEAAQSHPRAFERVPLSPNLLRGIVRHEEADRGMVACFTDKRFGGLIGLTEAVKRFATTQDLGEFGRFRYAFAYKTSSGKVLVATFFAHSSMNVGKMFPERGDAAGRDSPVVPRPKASRRMLTAEVEGRPYAVRLYDTNQQPAEIAKFYVDWMAQHGWTPLGQRPGEGAGYLRAADGHTAILSFSQHKGRTTVGITEVKSALATLTVTAR